MMESKPENMNNIKMTEEGNKLVFEIDLSKDSGLSKSKKTTTIASSRGNVNLKCGAVFSLNVYKKVEEKKK